MKSTLVLSLFAVLITSTSVWVHMKTVGTSEPPDHNLPRHGITSQLEVRDTVGDLSVDAKSRVERTILTTVHDGESVVLPTSVFHTSRKTAQCIVSRIEVITAPSVTTNAMLTIISSLPPSDIASLISLHQSETPRSLASILLAPIPGTALHHTWSFDAVTVPAATIDTIVTITLSFLTSVPLFQSELHTSSSSIQFVVVPGSSIRITVEDDIFTAAHAIMAEVITLILTTNTIICIAVPALTTIFTSSMGHSSSPTFVSSTISDSYLHCTTSSPISRDVTAIPLSMSTTTTQLRSREPITITVAQCSISSESSTWTTILEAIMYATIWRQVYDAYENDPLVLIMPCLETTRTITIISQSSATVMSIATSQMDNIIFSGTTVYPPPTSIPTGIIIATGGSAFQSTAIPIIIPFDVSASIVPLKTIESRSSSLPTLLGSTTPTPTISTTFTSSVNFTHASLLATITAIYVSTTLTLTLELPWAAPPSQSSTPNGATRTITTFTTLTSRPIISQGSENGDAATTTTTRKASANRPTSQGRKAIALLMVVAILMSTL